MSEEKTEYITDASGLISEEWLAEVGFKWYMLDNQVHKHWLLWIGDTIGKERMFRSADDLGIEIGRMIRDERRWHCWFRSDVAGRYHRFIHLRYVSTRAELVRLIEALTDQAWDPANNLYGAMRTPEHAAYLRQEAERLDIKWRVDAPAQAKWTLVEKDDTRAGALPEHLQAYVDREEP